MREWIKNSRVGQPGACPAGPGGGSGSLRARAGVALLLGAAILACAADRAADQTAGARDDAEARFAAARRAMVETQMRARGIRSERVLAALREVPRHRFVPPELARQAYGDHPLPIGFNQTISQPYIVAFMTEAVEAGPEDRVLEIGTGSGYQAAVLAELAKEVYTIEIIPELAARAERTLRELGYANVHVKTGDGYEGWPEHAPFDGIVVTAAAPQVPPALTQQLAEGGRMAIPVGARDQEMRVITKRDGKLKEERVFPVRFVPMVKPKQPAGG